MKQLFFLLLLVLLYPLAAQDSTFKRPDPLAATELKGSLTIDGLLDEPEWAKLKPYSAFYQREPNENAPATQKTEVYIYYDREALYIGAKMHDTSPDSIIRR